MAGSGARFAYYAGVCRAATELGIRPAMIAGVSGGALVGSALACGVLDRVENIIDRIRDKSIAYAGFRFGRMLTLAPSWYTLDPLRRLVYDNIDPRQLATPFIAGTVHYRSSEYTPWVFMPGASLVKNHWLQDAVIASAAVPVVTKGHRIEGELYYDGGARHVIGDIETLRERGYADQVIIVVSQRLNQPMNRADNDEPSNWIAYAELIMNRFIVQAYHEDVEDVREWQRAKPDVHVIQPSEPLGSGMDFSRDLMQRRYAVGLANGYNELRAILS